MKTFRDVINRWPTRKALADILRIRHNRVRVWAKRNVIPPDQFNPVIRAAKKCGFDDITYALLASITPGAAKEKEI